MVNKNTGWASYKHHFKRQEIDAKTVLLSEGKIAKRAYYIEKGSIRVWFNNMEKEVTFQFFFEGSVVSSVESFQKGLPSMFSIESLEPCILHSISKKDFDIIIQQSPAIKSQFEDTLFERLLLYQKLFISRIKDSPEQRYKELLKNSPEIIQRVPLHYIASYLGITPVSLSRIRKRY
jgi:CRP-like cAMP-binding protein